MKKIFFRKCQKRTSNLFRMQRTFWAINALIWILINWTFFSLLNWTGKWLITNFENLFYGLNFSSKIYNPCLLYRRCKFKTNKFNFFNKNKWWFDSWARVSSNFAIEAVTSFIQRHFTSRDWINYFIKTQHFKLLKSNKNSILMNNTFKIFINSFLQHKTYRIWKFFFIIIQNFYIK